MAHFVRVTALLASYQLKRAFAPRSAQPLLFAGPAPGVGSFPGFPSILDRWIRYEEEKFRDR